MAVSLHSASSLQLISRRRVYLDFLPVSTCSPSQGSRCRSFQSPERAHCILPQIPSDRFKLNIESATHLSSLSSRQFGKDYVLPGRHFLSLKTRRSSAKPKLVCTAAAASASSSSHADFHSVTFLGRDFLQKDVQFVCAAVATVLLAGANKILYKMALVPLSRYPLFLAQFSTVTYVVAYSSILLMRYRAGIVTKEMLAVPKGKFVLIGALEALGIAMGTASAAILPGATIPVLAQVFLVWQLLLSSTILRKRYSFGQIGGCLLVIAGVVVVVASGSGGVVAGTLQQSGYFWPLVMIGSTFFFAAATILKELLFQDGAQKLKGGNLDLFVVNTFGSLFQTLFVSMILPVVFNARGVPFHQIPHSLKEGYVCFVNIGSQVSGCEGAPLVPLLYVVVNMAFNIFSLSLLKHYSAIVSSLCVTLSIPLSIWAFTLPWPYLGVPPSLPSGFFLGAAILIGGLAIYSLSKPVKEKIRRK